MSHNLDFFDMSSQAGPGGSSDPPPWNPWKNQSTSMDLVYPDIDMSTALQGHTLRDQADDNIPSQPTSGDVDIAMKSNQIHLERVDLVPKLYAYSVQAALLPSRKVQGELVKLYFRHIHPLFPAVDEFRFISAYRRFRNQEELMDPGDFLIHLAVLAAGFSHLSEIQLHRTPYRSLHDGSGALYDQVKARYWASTALEPTVLTQVALIISLWSPAPPASIHDNNSYWLDIAFKHANVAKLWNASRLEVTSSGNESARSRHRVLWWCCIVRDRHMAVVLRRPYRLHSLPFTPPLPTALNFGTESTQPSFEDLPGKQIAMAAFISLCKLSEIMARVAHLQRQFRFALDWQGTVDGSEGFGNILELNTQLNLWRRNFETEVSGFRESEEGEKSEFEIHVNLLRIISYALVTILYQFCFLLHHRDIDRTMCQTSEPLERMKDGAYQVASNLDVVRINDGIDHVPIWMLGWFVNPLLIYQIGEEIDSTLPSKDSLIFFLKRLTRRSTAAQTIAQVVVQVVRAVGQGIERSGSAGAEHLNSNMGMGTAVPANVTLLPEEIRWRTEAKILAVTLNVLDSSLEYNSLPNSEKLAEVCRGIFNT